MLTGLGFGGCILSRMQVKLSKIVYMYVTIVTAYPEELRPLLLQALQAVQTASLAGTALADASTRTTQQPVSVSGAHVVSCNPRSCSDAPTADAKAQLLFAEAASKAINCLPIASTTSAGPLLNGCLASVDVDAVLENVVASMLESVMQTLQHQELQSAGPSRVPPLVKQALVDNLHGGMRSALMAATRSAQASMQAGETDMGTMLDKAASAMLDQIISNVLDKGVNSLGGEHVPPEVKDVVKRTLKQGVDFIAKEGMTAIVDQGVDSIGSILESLSSTLDKGVEGWLDTAFTLAGQLLSTIMSGKEAEQLKKDAAKLLDKSRMIDIQTLQLPFSKVECTLLKYSPLLKFGLSVATIAARSFPFCEALGSMITAVNVFAAEVGAMFCAFGCFVCIPCMHV